MKRLKDLERFQFTIFLVILSSPLGFCIGELGRIAFHPLDRFHLHVELLAYAIKLVGVSSFGFMDSLLEVGLDLTEGLEARDEIVVEDCEIGKRLSLRLTRFLLLKISDIEFQLEVDHVPASCQRPESYPYTDRW